MARSPFAGSPANHKHYLPSVHSSTSTDAMSTYQEQISNINNISPSNIDYKTISKHLVSQEDLLKLQGGDVARYIHQQIENAAKTDSPKTRRTRSLSFSAFLEESRRGSTASDINIPGGFRREFLINQLLQQNRAPPNFLTQNFVEFLSIYGHFAGEDFSDDDDEDDDDYESVFDEESLLLEQRRSPPKKQKKPVAKGTASVTKTFFLVFKSLVGSGVLFLPRAFANGGLLFSTITLIVFGFLTYVCYFVLIQSKKTFNKTSFGELGFKTYGKPLKISIMVSIIISQIGFVSTYILFTAENMTSFIENVLGYTVKKANIVVAQCVFLIPLVLIRDLTKLSLTSVISSTFIIIGLVIIFWFSGIQLIEEGLGDGIVNFSSSWPMLIGVAVTSFEGIGLILPIESSMARPDKFPFVLAVSMLLITALFVTVGVVGYTAFGESVKSIIILNLPQGNVAVQLILVLYSMAVFLTAPLQLFPAIKIGESVIFNSSLFIDAKTKAKISAAGEGKLYHNSGKYNSRIKWLKNLERSLAVVLICTIAYLNANHIDKFVSFNGCFACIPLVYIYPPLIHLKTYKINPQKGLGTWLKVFDYVLIVVGFVAVVYTTFQIVVLE